MKIQHTFADTKTSQTFKFCTLTVDDSPKGLSIKLERDENDKLSAPIDVTLTRVEARQVQILLNMILGENS